MTTSLVRALEQIAEVLQVYADPSPGGGLKWNGTEYAKAESRHFDPYAAKWCSALTAIAGMLRSQDFPLSERQKSFIERLLFGGMGSLSDFAFDESRLGSAATRANRELGLLRASLFAQLQQS